MKRNGRIAAAIVCGYVAFCPLASFSAIQQNQDAQTLENANSQESFVALKQSTQAQETSREQNELQKANQNYENTEVQQIQEQNRDQEMTQGENTGERQEKENAGKQNQETGGTKKEKNQRSQERRSQVALAVQTMERIGENNQGIGEQVRTIAQSQKNKQEEIEESLIKAQNRSGIVKFLIGSNYGKLKEAKNGLAEQENKIEEMKRLAAQIEDEADSRMLLEQIAIMERIRENTLAEIEEENRGFSLFGWLFKRLAR